MKEDNTQNQQERERQEAEKAAGGAQADRKQNGKSADAKAERVSKHERKERSASGEAGSRSTVTTRSQAQSSAWKRLLTKKWVFPAVYMAAAAIILTIMWTYQQSGQQALDDGDLGIDPVGEELMPDDASVSDALNDPAVPVNTETKEETMAWPVQNPEEIKVVQPFYDAEAGKEEKQAAMVQYENSFIPNMGITLARSDNASFDVIAAMSGTVTRVEKDHPLTGQLVEITHENGLKTVYYSLEDIVVEPDAEVTRGETIARAGRNEIGKNLGPHLSFEVYQEGTPVNPENMLE